MYYTLLFGITFTYCVSAELNRLQGSQKFSYNLRSNVVSKTKNNVMKLDANDSYFVKSSNLMRMPTNFEEKKTSKRSSKKHPKSTIQKIIARNRKNKMLMHNRLTSKPTIAPASDDLLDDFVPEIVDDLTTQPAQKKKVKKWNNRLNKYQRQAQKMQPKSKNNSKWRSKRNAERDNTVILQDFDEFEFLDKKKDYDLVKTHYKRYW